MKMTRSASLVGVLLAGISATTYATKDSMTLTQDGITFEVSSFDDRRRIPYAVSFEQDNVSYEYKFNLDGFVASISVGIEQYRVLYESNGDFERVRRRSDCEEALDAVCDEGVPSVCSIAGYGSPLTDAATASMETFCESFGSACPLSDGDESFDCRVTEPSRGKAESVVRDADMATEIV